MLKGNIDTPGLSLRLKLRENTSTSSVDSDENENQVSAGASSENSTAQAGESSTQLSRAKKSAVVMTRKLKKSDLPSNTPPRKNDKKQHCDTCSKSVNYSKRNSKPTQHQCILCRAST